MAHCTCGAYSKTSKGSSRRGFFGTNNVLLYHLHDHEQNGERICFVLENLQTLSNYQSKFRKFHQATDPLVLIDRDIRRAIQ